MEKKETDWRGMYEAGVAFHEVVVKERDHARARLERLEKRFLEIADQLERQGMPLFAQGIRDVIEEPP